MKDIYNPAIEIFGNRVYAGQSSIEFLHEFLLLVASDKKCSISDNDIEFSTSLPEFNVLQSDFINRDLYYSSKYQLQLKLFSFLGASKLSTREPSHREQLSNIKSLLEKNIIAQDKKSFINTISDLLLGFQGAGKNRTWCAQSFFPISKSLLAKESIWQVSKGKTDKYWEDALEHFSHTQHLFLAKGGEVFYRQICLALSKSKEDIVEWLDKLPDKSLYKSISEVERFPKKLYTLLKCQLAHLLEYNSLETLVSFFEQTINDPSESNFSNYSLAGTCPDNSWKLGYLLAVEMSRLLSLQLDPIEKITQLEMLFDLHILRHLCHLSAIWIEGLHTEGTLPLTSGWLRFGLVISPEDCEFPRLRSQSQISFRYIEGLMHDAVHSIQPSEEWKKAQETKKKKTDFYGEADKAYGFAVFRKISKHMGLVIPRTGSGERMILTESILRTLVFTLVSPGSDLTYDTFKEVVAAHFGLFFDREGIRRTMTEIGYPCDDPGHDVDAWVQDLLDRAGMLVHLSDSCSLVRNPVAAAGADA